MNYGIQCKVRKDKKLTQKEIVIEIEEAKKFTPKLHTYIIITTSDRDSKLQSIVKKISDGQKKEWFEVQILFWEDVTLLLAEHPHLIKKYYSGFIASIEQTAVIGFSKTRDHINEQSPLLVGCLFDLSRQMIVETIGKLNKPVGFDFLIKEVVFRVAAFCKDEQIGSIRNHFYLFAYGFGFGDFKKNILNFFEGFGIEQFTESKGLNIAGNVRNLFQEASLTNSLPIVPNITILDSHWSLYEQSVKNQVLDIGVGNANLLEGLTRVLQEFKDQLRRSFYSHPILLLISNGRSEDSYDKLIERADEIKKQKVQIVSLLLAEHNFLVHDKLYGQPINEWTNEVKLLFDLSSEFDENINFNNQILGKAKNSNWTIENSPKLFFQLNQSDMVNEIIELMFGSLKGNDKK